MTKGEELAAAVEEEEKLLVAGELRLEARQTKRERNLRPAVFIVSDIIISIVYNSSRRFLYMIVASWMKGSNEGSLYSLQKRIREGVSSHQR